MPRTTPQTPIRAADQSFVPLPHVAAHVVHAVGAGRRGVGAHGGQIVLAAAVARGARDGVSAVVELIKFPVLGVLPGIAEVGTVLLENGY